ncbi:response regulator transcription factor [Streptomyces sp. HSG2]|uniref:response regulator transcription factor n=2 Tax=unclassified Streptomyces TaxID=2593676 RepID=UPI001F5B52B0|nr:response regulator transcription factor [Streptomyces sp. HSG2]
MIQAVIAIADVHLRTRVMAQLAGCDGIAVVTESDSAEATPRLSSARGRQLMVSDTAVGQELAKATQVLFLVAAADCPSAQAALEAGVRGVLTHDVTGLELVAATRLVAAGCYVLDPAFAAVNRHVVGQPKPVATLPNSLPLSSRERQVMELLMNGRTNREIATSLFLAETTVKSHVSTILRKLGVANRVQAVASYGGTAA